MSEAAVSQATGTVAVVITTYNHSRFLDDSIGSVLAQSHPCDELIVVDDGSDDDPAAVVAAYPSARLIRQENRGLSGARNTGLIAAKSDFITFLDADDRLLPEALGTGLAAMAEAPGSAFVYGGYRMVGPEGARLTHDILRPDSDLDYRTLLRRNVISMHGTVLYRRALLVDLGGFDETLRRCEDHDMYLRIAREYPIRSHGGLVAEYRWHGANMSGNAATMLQSALAVHDRHKEQARRDPHDWAAWRQGRVNWQTFYAMPLYSQAIARWRREGEFRRFVGDVAAAVRLAPRVAAIHGPPRVLKHMAQRALARLRAPAIPPTTPAPRVGAVDFGDFARVTPVSTRFGFERGTPIDRYYIETFLARHAGDIAGRVLEIGDSSYTRRFGGELVGKADVLHVVAGNPDATFVGDLSDPAALPAEAFDCMVLTQTLNLIYDIPQAVRMIHRALKPGGIALVTVPGNTQVDPAWADRWYWSLTALSARRVMEEAFRPEDVEMQAYGNVYAATAFFQGLAAEEVDRAALDFHDPAYLVTIGVRARKADA